MRPKLWGRQNVGFQSFLAPMTAGCIQKNVYFLVDWTKPKPPHTLADGKKVICTTLKIHEAGYDHKNFASSHENTFDFIS